jgi:tetratricopeptide (TPR) repeat protein
MAGRFEEAIVSFRKALDHHRLVGDEQGLAMSYSQLGKTFHEAGRLRDAEKCLNNASEHFIKLGQPAGEVSTLRQLAKIYEQDGNVPSAIRCVERAVTLGTVYRLNEVDADSRTLARLRGQIALSHVENHDS